MKKGILEPGFLKNPAGPTNFERLGTFGWNNLSCRISHAITCQACLRNWPKCKKGKSRTVSIFLGLEIVEECCGALLDTVYLELGAEFTIRRLSEVLAKPEDHPMVWRALRKLAPRLGYLILLETSR